MPKLNYKYEIHAIGELEHSNSWYTLPLTLKETIRSPLATQVQITAHLSLEHGALYLTARDTTIDEPKLKDLGNINKMLQRRWTHSYQHNRNSTGPFIVDALYDAFIPERAQTYCPELERIRKLERSLRHELIKREEAMLSSLRPDPVKKKAA